MEASTILGVIGAYFLVLMGVNYLTGRKATTQSFFTGDRKSPWFVVAFGMIGASLSGITFISIPGGVFNSGFAYMQMVLGYLVGYLVIVYVLLPIYYKLQVVSIYEYLSERFGVTAHRTGALLFLVSRTVGASIRLLLVANILQLFVFAEWGVPFEITVLVSIALIWLYTFKAGIKTIVWTDTLQTFFMLLALGMAIVLLYNKFPEGKGMLNLVMESDYSNMFVWDFSKGSHFLKFFVGGMFITIAMTGLDQDMMQKNLSCKNLKQAQLNMLSMSVVLVIVNAVFLGLGVLMFEYADLTGMELPYSETGKFQGDLVFPELAINGGLGWGLGIVFLIGLIAAAYSSADSALTSLTTSVCVDFMDIKNKPESQQEGIRKWVHLILSGVLFFVIWILSKTMDTSAIMQLIYFAGFLYGPLLGLFFIGIFTKMKLYEKLIPVMSLAAIGLTIKTNYILDLMDLGFSLGALTIVLNMLYATLLFIAIRKRN